MKRILIAAAVAAAALNAAACASLSPFAVNTKADPEAQKIQAEAKAAIDKALAVRLDHCDIRGSLTLGVGGTSVAEAGTTLGLTCPPKPWDSVVPAETKPSQ